MQRNDANRFRESLDATLEFYGQDPASDSVTRKWWSHFSNWTIEQFESALSAHERRSKFAPKPADLFEIADKSSGRLTADEAWSLAVKAADESETVVWTHECAVAFSAASEVLQSGDKIGARMAFRAAYDRACEESAGPVRWEISLGYDQARRDAAILAAVEKRRLTREQAQRHVSLPPPTADGQAIAGLITGKVTAMPTSEKTLERLRELKRSINAETRQREAQIEEAKIEAQQAEQRRREELREQHDRLITEESEQAARAMIDRKLRT